ncbi:MAG: hypothetical protein QOJ74_913 [Ilumatobacteraceae bacterium]|jgi:hypothetical protein|nr:hypothetical protein [Ilumatobacteraceae bacterium]
MSYGLVLIFEGVTEKEYWSVNEKLGINQDSTGDWPEGMVFHTGGPTQSGGFAVIELWKSKAAQEAFMGSRLGAALAASGVPAPSQMIETDTVNEKFLN